jgi:hypothetical protein
MKLLGNVLILVGFFLLAIAGYIFYISSGRISNLFLLLIVIGPFISVLGFVIKYLSSEQLVSGAYNRFTGIIGILWGGSILVYSFYQPWSLYRGAYLIGSITGTVFGAIMFIAGVYTFNKAASQKDNLERAKVALAKRPPISDQQMFNEFFADGSVGPDVPGIVRRLFAQHIGIPDMKLFPDDDLTSFLANGNIGVLVADLEKLFRIKIKNVERVKTFCNIGDVSRLVEKKRRTK